MYVAPPNTPHSISVWGFFRRAKATDLWGEILTKLIKKKRVRAFWAVSPTYAVIDSQSVKTADAAEKRGIDGGKKLREGSATSLLIRWEIFLILWFMQLIFMTRNQGF